MYRVYTLTPYGGTRTDCVVRDESKAKLRTLELEHAGYMATYEQVY